MTPGLPKLGRRTAARPAIALIAAAGAFALLAIGVAVGDPPDAAEKTPNPHWDASACGQCHADAANPKTIAPADADRVCYSCHDGKKAAAETHPVGRPLAGERFQQPAGWPLVDGKLGCLSCHDPAAKHCDRQAKRPLLNPMFLRGRPVGSVTAQLCTQCHKEASYQRLNPHIQLAKNQVDQERCNFCHSEPLSADAMVRTGHPALVRPERELCQGCHPTHVEYFNPGHVGSKLTAGMLARVSDPQRSFLVGPMDKGHTIRCATCHNPHQQGVFHVRSELAPRALKVVSGDDVKPTVSSNQLCVACHEMTRGSVSFRVDKQTGDAAAPAAPDQPRIVPAPNCPVDGESFGKDSITATVRNMRIRFHSADCMRKFQVDPDRYLKRIEAATTRPDTGE